MSIVAGVLLGTLAETTPLLYTALGETVAQRAGVINVGLEGILLTSAFTASFATYHIGNPYIGVGIGMLTGIAFALLFGFFALVLHADQVVTGVVFNLFALGITGTLYRFLFALHDKSLITSQLPLIHHTVTILTPLSLPAVAFVWWWLYSTRSGLELRACGEQPLAADAAGIALIFDGAMAGIAGAFLSIADSNTFVPNMSAGKGFIALAIVTAGRWNPIGCLVASLLFGFTNSLQFQAQTLGFDTLYRHTAATLHLTMFLHRLNLDHFPYQLFLALPYVVTMLILFGSSRSTRAPAALGRPYRKE
jgi:ABC-type uncharacterized transport system permease subunit